MSNIPINSGTGPRVAVDAVGTDNYQIVKIMQAGVGNSSPLSSSLLVTASGVTIASVATGSVSVVNVLSASGITVASIATGTVNIANTPTITVGNTVTVTGSVNVGITSVTATTGTFTIAGPVFVTNTGPFNVATITTLLGTVSVSGGGGGVQYPINDTSMLATGTGTIILGLQSGATTSRALALTTTGGIFNIQTIASITTLLGTVSVSGGGGGIQYGVDTTAMAATATGTVILGMQTGATTARGIAVTTTGAQFVNFAGTQAVTAANVTVASIATGTMNVINVLSASGVTVASVATGTMNVVNVLSASGVTIASITTGTMNVINVLSASGVTIASVATGTVSLGTAQYAIAGTSLGITGGGVLVMGIQSGATTARGLVIGTTGGLFIDSMPAVGGGQQYAASSTAMAITATGTVIIGIQSGATTGRALILSTTGGLIIDTMPAVGGGQQYPVDSTSLGATGTGTLILGVQSGATTARGLALTTTGGIFNVQNIAQITTLLGTVSVSGGGGGVQYGQDTTAMAATATGTIVLGMQTGATTGRALAMTTTGAALVSFVGTPAVTAANVTIASVTTGTMNVINVLSASGVTIASITTGTMNVINVLSASGVTIASIAAGTVNLGTAQYAVNSTASGTTGGGVLIMGIQSGATTARGLVIGTTGGLFIDSMPAVGGGQQYQQSATSVAATGTGTIVMGIQATTTWAIALTASGQQIVSVANTPTITGTVSAFLLATTGTIGSIVATAHASRFQAYALATTSAAAGVIIKTSGASTLYITDMLVSVSGPMMVQLCSETTAFGQVYLATNGGFVENYVQPIICTSAQSFRVVLSSSGSAGVTVVGYTVT